MGRCRASALPQHSVKRCLFCFINTATVLRLVAGGPQRGAERAPTPVGEVHTLRQVSPLGEGGKGNGLEKGGGTREAGTATAPLLPDLRPCLDLVLYATCLDAWMCPWDSCVTHTSSFCLIHTSGFLPLIHTWGCLPLLHVPAALLCTRQ